jgi:ParB family chromosome partitioning protein
MVKRAPARKRPRKAKPSTKGLGPAECRLTEPSEALAEVTDAIEKAGGCAVGAYKDPLGGHPVLIAILPIDAVEPTPFQRDLSDAHHKRLADVINKTGRFLDPIIAVVAPRDGFWTPNGRHRLEAMRRLGAKSISALVVADREVAWQILALNTEKAHNLKERALEVIRIYRGLVDEDASRPETQFAFYLDEAALVTLGVCYERMPRFGGGVYHPILRRLEIFIDEPLRAAIKDHEKRAALVLDLEEKVAAAVKKLKERGLVSPYLRSFVVARINPLRWIKGEPPPLDEVLKTMRERAGKFNVEKIRPQDSWTAGRGGVDFSLLVGGSIMAKKQPGAVLPKLTEAEQDLIWHMEHGYQLETDSLGGDPVLRRLKDDEVVRPASAKRNTVKALEERGLISSGKSRAPPSRSRGT